MYYWFISVLSFVPVNNRYRVLDNTERDLYIKAVLLALCGISDRPGNIAGTAFPTFLIERFPSACLFSLKHQ